MSILAIRQKRKAFYPSVPSQQKPPRKSRGCYGACDGTRTCDLRITNALHYQLCYTSISTAKLYYIFFSLSTFNVYFIMSFIMQHFQKFFFEYFVKNTFLCLFIYILTRKSFFLCCFCIWKNLYFYFHYGKIRKRKQKNFILRRIIICLL